MELTIEQALQQGVAAQKEGKLQDAERLYRAILQSQPAHPDANHNLGVLAVSVNKADAALPLFKTALEANPKIEQFWLSYIDALIKEKQFEDAKQVLEHAKKEGMAGDKLNTLQGQLASINQSENVDSASPSQQQINNLLDHYQNGRLSDAEKLAVHITQDFPKHPFSWKVLGVVLQQTGRITGSLTCMQKSTQLAPQDPEAHNNLGNIFQELDKLEEAEKSYTKAIALKPDYAEAHYNLGNALQELRKLEEAEESYTRSIALKSDYAEAHCNLGITLQEQGRLEEAEARFQQAIALEAGYAEAHNNLGITLQELGRLGEAEASYTEAITLKPNFAEVHCNLGVTLKELGRLEEAEASYNKAIALKPDYIEALWNLSVNFNLTNSLDAEIQAFQNILTIDSDNQGLRANVNLAICNFLKGDFPESKKYLLAAEEIHDKTSWEYKNEKVYQRYLSKILEWHQHHGFDNNIRTTDKILYVIGESHSLIIHYLRIKSFGCDLFAKAMLIRGCKQWHLGNSVRNQYKYKFEGTFCTLPKSSDVLLAIGEIDCRLDSGIIPYKNKYPEKEINDVIVTTIENYLDYIVNINSAHHHNIFIQGVPCPNIDIKKYSKKEIVELVAVIKIFNFELKNLSKDRGFEFIDVHKITDRGDGFSNSIYHIDGIHLSPEGFLEAWNIYVSERQN